MQFNWYKDLARLYLPIYQFESDTTKIAYAGYSSIKKNYYVRLLLAGKNNQTFIGRRWFWQIPALIRSNNLDMIISEISPLVMNRFHKLNGFVVPEWIRMKINIDRPLSEIIKKSASDFRDVMRKIRNHNMTYEILTDKESYKYFNDKLYLPYITSRHGEEAWIEDLNIIWKSTPSPVLMAIKENDIMVGGAIIRKSDESLELLRLGLLDGNHEYRRHGVIGAIYYFGILEGQKMGCQYLDVGGTRPFLTDGLTRFKLGLGADFISNLPPKAAYLWLGVNENSVSTEEFFNRNPVVHINKDFSVARPVNK
jgi:hypothetical protein